MLQNRYDILIVGAGFAGLVMAERISNILNKKCLLIDKRDHIGGNAYDYYDRTGVLVHAYGPHYFRTDSKKVIDYLTRFTEWLNVDYEIKAYTENRYWHFPVNLNTFEQLIGKPASSEQFEKWLTHKRIPSDNPSSSEEVVVSQIGRELYEKFFKNYTIKQWNKHPRELNASVCRRVPVRTNRDNRYLEERFQAMPKAGYTKLFEQMVEQAGSNLEISLNTDYHDIKDKVNFNHLVYSGPIDELYDYCYGPLPYRSLMFKHLNFTKEQLCERVKVSGKIGFWQPVVQVNYPNEEEYTRIVEIKHVTGQIINNTTIVEEYPCSLEKGKEPYYPVPETEAEALYQKYKQLTAAEQNVSFIGRLARYSYLNMDQVVEMALDEFDKLASQKFYHYGEQ